MISTKLLKETISNMKSGSNLIFLNLSLRIKNVSFPMLNTNSSSEIIQIPAKI